MACECLDHTKASGRVVAGGSEFLSLEKRQTGWLVPDQSSKSVAEGAVKRRKGGEILNK